MIRGKFITMEGGEGAGKSSNLRLVHELLTAAGKDVVVTREPGGTPLGERLRALLLESGGDPMAVDTELMLMFAARAEHLAKIIRPALDAGKWVLCDRFTDATYAYQGGGRGVPMERVASLEQWVQQGLQPDATLLLDVSPEIGGERVNRRGQQDRFEAEKREFFVRVRNTYLARAARYPDRFKVVDANAPLELVQRQLTEIVRTLL